MPVHTELLAPRGPGRVAQVAPSLRTTRRLARSFAECTSVGKRTCGHNERACIFQIQESRGEAARRPEVARVAAGVLQPLRDAARAVGDRERHVATGARQVVEWLRGKQRVARDDHLELEHMREL
jgi:hypothetical protein